MGRDTPEILLPNAIAEAEGDEEGGTPYDPSKNRSVTPVRLTPIESKQMGGENGGGSGRELPAPPRAMSKPKRNFPKVDEDAKEPNKKTELPPSVHRRRPSLADVLGGDASDPAVQMKMAVKIAEAAAAQADGDGNAGQRSPRNNMNEDDDDTTGGVVDPDRIQAIVMPTLTFLATVVSDDAIDGVLS